MNFYTAFIYIVYEKAIDSNGRWLKLKYNDKNIGVSNHKTVVKTEFLFQLQLNLNKVVLKKVVELQKESKHKKGGGKVAADVGEVTSELRPTSCTNAPPTEPVAIPDHYQIHRTSP